RRLHRSATMHMRWPATLFPAVGAAHRFEMLARVGLALSRAQPLRARRRGVTSRALSGAKVRSRPEARGGFTVRGDEVLATQALSRLMATMQIAAVHAALRLSWVLLYDALLRLLGCYRATTVC